MEKILLKAKKREASGKANKHLRAQGQIPAVIYGHGLKSASSIVVDAKQLEATYLIAGSNKIIGIKVDDTTVKNGLFQDVQHDPITGQLIHADFYLVSMDEKIETEVPLHYVGESVAVYQQEGTLVKNLETIEVEALPGDLPENIEVDISVLDDFEKEIRVSDLKIPAEVTLLTDTEELVARVEPPRSDEELAELDEEITDELPEGVAEDQTVEKEGGTGEGSADREGAGDEK